MYAPTTVALAVIAAIGYCVGRRTRSDIASSSDSVQADLRRAKAVVSHIEEIAERIRTGLAAHGSRIATFKDCLGALNDPQAGGCGRDLLREIDSILEPTLTLANQISQARDELRQQSNCLMSFTETRTDTLTGAWNRKVLNEQLASSLAMLRRYGQPCSLAIFDIDHFKRVNDAHGHVYGDQVLKAVARLLGGGSRETDVVARYGGEEFVVVMPHTDLAGAAVFAERIRVAVEKSGLVTISGGVSAAHRDDEPQTFLNRADKALYAAKGMGRNRIVANAGVDAAPGEGSALSLNADESVIGQDTPRCTHSETSCVVSG
jgi:diguanylate cyclase (GGDEF)-like protein